MAAPTSPVSRSRPRRSLLAALLLAALGTTLATTLATAPGCGLFSEGIGWRAYPLRDIGVDEATTLVREVVRDFMTARFGGVEIIWDGERRNLQVEDISDGERVLSLRVHLEPADEGVDVEMLALVHNLVPGEAPRVWGDPQQDVPLEEQLYDAILAEYLERRGG